MALKKKPTTNQLADLDALLVEAQAEAATKDAAEKKGKEPSMEDLTFTIKDLEEKLLRKDAEFINFRKRMEQDKADFAKYAAKNVILEFLQAYDLFQLAISHTPEELKNNSWVMGMEQVQRQFENTLQSLGIQKISTVGQTVDYSKHEVIAEVEGTKDVIVREMTPGYTLHGSVIRAARVEVGKG